MRADRLISILLLLQTRGRMTAGELSQQLEVSERTIYRDLEALSISGVPIYSEHGPGGGYALLDSYRTTLTGLTESEVRTLFMSGVYGPLADLGLAEALEIALLKLAASLPETQQQRAERMRQRIHLDAIGWFQSPESVPHLHALQEAVWRDQQVHIVYRRGDGEVRERTIDPYGLVAKASIWYVVASIGEEMRVYRVSRILSLDFLDEHFEHPTDFDLSAYWTEWCHAFETGRNQYPVTLRVAPETAQTMAQFWGDEVRDKIEDAAPDHNGWRQIVLHYDTLEWARNSLIALGPTVEILDPPELREAILELAANIVEFYARVI